jgi:hypothetical protein
MEFLLLAANEGRMMQPAAWLTPRTLIDKAGLWDEVRSPNDDGEFFCRVLLRSTGIAFCEGAKVFYRTHTTSSLRTPTSEELRRGLFHSCESIARHMLAAEESPRVRRAAANLYQSYIYTVFPEPGDLIQQAEAQVVKLGGSSIRPPMGPRTAVLTCLLGWKSVWRLKHWWHRGKR